MCRALGACILGAESAGLLASCLFLPDRPSAFGSVFTASIERAIEAGDAEAIAGAPLNLFWFAHHTVLMAALTRLPVIPCLDYGNPSEIERQLCQFILRGIGLNEAAIAFHLDRALSPIQGPSVAAESA